MEEERQGRRQKEEQKEKEGRTPGSRASKGGPSGHVPKRSQGSGKEVAAKGRRAQGLRFLLRFNPPLLKVTWSQGSAGTQSLGLGFAPDELQDPQQLHVVTRRLVDEHPVLSDCAAQVDALLRRLASASLPVYRVSHEAGAPLLPSPGASQAEQVGVLPPEALFLCNQRVLRGGSWWLCLAIGGAWGGAWVQEQQRTGGVKVAERCQPTEEAVRRWIARAKDSDASRRSDRTRSPSGKGLLEQNALAVLAQMRRSVGQPARAASHLA